MHNPWLVYCWYFGLSDILWKHSFLHKRPYAVGPWSHKRSSASDCTNNRSCLKTTDTIGNCQRPAFPLGVSQHMHKITNLWKFERRSCEITMTEKTLLSHEVVCFQMLDLENSNFKLEVSKSNSWKITSFSKTTLLSREPFLTMLYTTNSSPLLVTKWGFMLIIIWVITNSVHCL